MLSLYKLEIFTVVVQEGSFSAAAERMYMTQSAVSQHIRSLEAGLGTELFRRGRRGVKLTFAGEKLYDYTRQILNLVAEAESAVTDVENLEGGQVKIAATPVVSVYLLPHWTGRFRNQYPRLTVALSTAITPGVVSSVLSHRAALGFVEGEINKKDQQRLSSLPLQEIPMFVVTGIEHPWGKQDTIDLKSLDHQPFITRQQGSQTRNWLTQLADDNALDLHIVGEFDNPESIKTAVASGMGITILPACSIQRELSAGTLHALGIEDMPLRRTLRLLWEQDGYFDPITRIFLKILASFFPQVVKVLP